jgi:hypothetical protein
MYLVLFLAACIFVPAVVVQGIVLLVCGGIFCIILAVLGIATLGAWAQYGAIALVPYGIILLGTLLWYAVKWFRRWWAMPRQPLTIGQKLAWALRISFALYCLSFGIVDVVMQLMALR